MMKRVLIIGDSPHFHGGVTNYTRPLAQVLAGSLDVVYLHSSTRTRDDKFTTRYGIREIQREEYNFKLFQLFNGKSVYKNYNKLDRDYSDWFDAEFSRFLDKINPDVVHVNELFGFSVSIFKIIKSRDIKLVSTIHDYWWLCPKKVMVDFNNKICDGPNDFSKCSYCIDKVRSSKSIIREKNVYKFKATFPRLSNLALKIKQETNGKIVYEDLKFGNIDHADYVNNELKSGLELRLNSIVSALNYCDTIICVSEDVKEHLLKYGVNENNVIVQHIGSVIAEKKIVHKKKLDENEIIFGFIGGVGYYKGVHQMVEAFTKLPDKLKLKSRLLIYGKYVDTYVNSIKRQYITSILDKERIVFHGTFTPDDIPRITNSIDISILPSLCADAAPQTIFESFSAGLPIIAPKVGGFPDFVEDGVNGMLYEKASVDGLMLCMTRIVENPSLISKFMSNIPDSKTIAQNVNELKRIYFT